MIQDYNKKDYKRIWMVTDTHFGARSNSTEWMDVMFEYMEDEFIPTLEKNYKEGDVLVHLGDVFDNRQTVSLKVMNRALTLFERISNIMDTYIIVGNHDIWHKKSNEVASVDMLKWIPNVQIMKDDEKLTWSNKSILLMPWRRDSDHELETLAKHRGSDYMFCHSEVKGAMLNKYSVNDHGNEVSVFNGMKTVFSGHIHIKQKKGNVHFLGNPYQMTRSDANNEKGMYLLDLSNDKLEFFENNVSPKFIKLNIMDVLELTIQEFKKLISNNFVDILIPSSVASKMDLNSLSFHSDGVCRKLDYIVLEDGESDEVTLEGDYKNFSIKEIIGVYVDEKWKDDNMNNKVKEFLGDLYKEINQD